jgi:hypothetical protein
MELDSSVYTRGSMCFHTNVQRSSFRVQRSADGIGRWLAVRQA